jgi:hypothetical protein
MNLQGEKDLFLGDSLVVKRGRKQKDGKRCAKYRGNRM